MIKITLVINGQNEFVRHVNEQDSAHVCKHITKLLKVFELLKEDLKLDDNINRIVVDCDIHVKSMPLLLPYISNMCGKLTHISCKSIYNPAILPYVRTKKNHFGTFSSVSTKNCNFHTGSSLVTSLFRAGNNTSKILHSIKHVFVQDYIVDISVHNIVCSFRLGHPVSSKNNMLHLKLKSLNVANVFKCADTDDRMYLHAFILNKFDSEWLKSISTDSYELGLCRLESIRINVCRTGVFNMFMSIPNGFKLQHHPDKLVLPFCTFFEKMFQTCT